MYAPPVNRNYAAVPKPLPGKKPKPAYKTSAPVCNGKIATDVYDCAMAMQVTLMQQELSSLSSVVRAQVHEATYNRRMPPNKDINVLADDLELFAAFDDLNNNNNSNGPTTSTFVNSIFVLSASSALLAGLLVILDPYKTYLKILLPEAVPDTLVVTKESSALQSHFNLSFCLLIISNTSNPLQILDRRL
jgi:hypothetical protein